MGKHSAGRPTAIDGHLQRIEDDLGFHAVTHRPTDDPTREQVEQNRKIEPAFKRSDVGDIAGPHPIRCRNFFGRELSVKYVFDNRFTMFGIRGHAESLAPLTAQVGGPHDPHHPLTTAAFTDATQVGHDRPRSIVLLAGLVKSHDVMAQLRVANATLTRRPLAPGVETRLRHQENTTHRARLPASKMLSDERVSQRDSLAKKAVAFFRTSRSSVTRASSRRSLRNSSSCDVSLPLPRNASTASALNCRTHECSISAQIPSARAICETGSFPSTTRRTASSLYSRGYFRRCSPMNHHSSRPRFEAYHGVQETGARPGSCALVQNVFNGSIRAGLRPAQRHPNANRTLTRSEGFYFASVEFLRSILEKL